MRAERGRDPLPSRPGAEVGPPDGSSCPTGAPVELALRLACDAARARGSRGELAPCPHRRREKTVNRRRICFVVTEILGLERNGGIGTAITHMSLLLAAQGHRVDVLHCGHRTVADDVWAERYRSAGVRLRMLDRFINVTPPSVAESWLAYQTLKHEDFDAVVF